MSELLFAQVAKVCHEANRAYCESINDFSQMPWSQAPEWQIVSAVYGVKLFFTEMLDGRRPGPSFMHESWMRKMLAAGWKYGPAKDAMKREHPCLVPYEQLPAEQRMKDYIFLAICEAYWKGPAR